MTRIGPDGQTTTTVRDDAGRVSSMSRAGMNLSYDYYATGRVYHAQYANGTRVRYDYDDAQRLVNIRHEQANTGTLLSIGYTYKPSGLIETITENAPGG